MGVAAPVPPPGPVQPSPWGPDPTPQGADPPAPYVHTHAYGEVAPAPARAPAEEPAPARAAPRAAGPVATQDDVAPRPLRVFSFGRNDKGTLGQGFFRPPGWEPCREVAVEGEVVVWARAGRANTAFITQSGRLLLSGSNAAYLFTDRESRGREAPAVPTVLEGRTVQRAFFGADATHILAVIEGRLHAWGRVSNALGIDTRSPTLEPKPVARMGSLSAGGGVGGEHIRQMVLSGGHSFALMADGSLLMTGGNSRGQLGMGARNNPYEVFVFTPPEGIQGVRFTAIACGTLHSAAVSDRGELYTTGRNEAGELGHELREDIYRFAPVTRGSIAGRRVVQVACSEQATFCITEDGVLHGTGSNGRGELGLGDLADTDQFVEIPLPEGRAVRQVTAGKFHVLVLCTDGALFGWGDNTHAQVTPGEKSRFVKTPTRLPGFDDQTVLGVSAGESHCLIMVA